MSNGLDLTSLALMLLMALALASLVGALLFLYRWLIRRRLFPQLPRIWGVDRKRFTILAGLFVLLSLAWLVLAFLARPVPEPPSQPAAPAANPAPETAQPPAPTVQPGEPGYFPLPHRQVQPTGEERALPPGPERGLPAAQSGQPGSPGQPSQPDQSGLPGGANESPSWATVTSLTTTSSTTTLTVPTTVKEPDISAAGQPPAAAAPAAVAPTAAAPATAATATTSASPTTVAPPVTQDPTSATTQTTSSTSTTLPVKQPAKRPAPPAKAAPGQAETPPAAPAKASPPAGPARYAACLGSHKTQAQAEVQKARLARAGVMAEIWAVDLPGKGRWHRVCAGDFASLAEAQAQAKAWEKQGLATTPFPVRRP